VSTGRALLASLITLAVSGVIQGQAKAPVSSGGVSFVEEARAVGIDFHHTNGTSPDKHLVETMGSGAVFFDYDADGWPDLFLVDGGSLVDPEAARRAHHRLYHNRDGRFEDVTSHAGIGQTAYGMGACAGDYDNDGHVDLYITSYGPNVFYRNRGDGTFADVTAELGVGEPRWSAACAFVDIDRDGDLDLFVVNYVDDVGKNPFCGNARLRTRFYCHPLNYGPLPNTLYRNDGKRFTDVSSSWGVSAHRGNGLGVVAADLDEDGWPDLFVSNDSVPNTLFHNVGGKRFEEVALRRGVAVATDGTARAGMGVDAADYDADGHLDLVVTNLDFETHSLFRSLGGGAFAYATAESGLGYTTLPFVGFGVALIDFDNDAGLDLAIVNGHLMDNAPLFRSGATYAQRNLLFHNEGGRRFREVGASAGPGLALMKVSRGLAVADIDNDGDVDLLVTNSGQTADLLRNDGGNRQNALLVRAVGVASNRDGVGARIMLTAGGRTQVREVKAGSSYLSQNDTRLHFGLGGADRVDRLEVRWPSGRTEVLADVPVNSTVTLREGEGIVERRPFAR